MIARRLSLFASFASGAIGLVVVSASACSTPSSDPRFTETTPDRDTFPEVADLLGHSCGSLDCHGNAARNLRIYGHEGMRLAATDRPLSKGATTAAEYDETFMSVVYLEPEIMTAVVTSGGANPERLTLVRKALGLEHHKGGALFQPGDDSDLCLLSWLAGHADTTICLRARANAF